MLDWSTTGTLRPLKKIVDAENDMKMSYFDEDRYFVVKIIEIFLKNYVS